MTFDPLAAERLTDKFALLTDSNPLEEVELKAIVGAFTVKLELAGPVVVPSPAVIVVVSAFVRVVARVVVD